MKAIWLIAIGLVLFCAAIAFADDLAAPAGQDTESDAALLQTTGLVPAQPKIPVLESSGEYSEYNLEVSVVVLPARAPVAAIEDIAVSPVEELTPETTLEPTPTPLPEATETPQEGTITDWDGEYPPAPESGSEG